MTYRSIPGVIGIVQIVENIWRGGLLVFNLYLNCVFQTITSNWFLVGSFFYQSIEIINASDLEIGVDTVEIIEAFNAIEALDIVEMVDTLAVGVDIF